MGNVYLSLQGNMGLSKAIDYFTSHQIPIALPMNDTQKYDLIADFNGGLQRISVKTSRCLTENGTYAVGLRNTGGAAGKLRVRPFDKNSCDYIFVLTGADKIYLIPSNIITAANSISVGKKYTEYEVFIKKLSEYAKEIKE
jgi:hypothetical protein